MSGHSKWSTIKRKKSAEDQKRGKIFSKLAKAIEAAARQGGSDENNNAKLRTIIAKAKEINMPKENIERAIKKGAGELEGINYEEFFYEGYGPGGAALLMEILTDNRRRTASEIRRILTRGGGSLGEEGCVKWMFEKKGSIIVNKANVDEEQLMNISIDNGAEDVVDEGDYYEIISQSNKFETLKNALKSANIAIESSEISMRPKNLITVQGKEAESLLRLVNELEEQDDVQNVYSNFDVPEEILKKIT